MRHGTLWDFMDNLSIHDYKVGLAGQLEMSHRLSKSETVSGHSHMGHNKNCDVNLTF